MTFSWSQPLGLLVYVLMLVAYGSNLNAAVVGACLTILAAVGWYMLDASEAYEDTVSNWDKIQRNIVLLPCLMACTAFCMVAGMTTMTSSLNLSFMMVMTSMAALVAGIVFWGHGFDRCREKAMQVWYVKAIVTTLFVLLNHLGYMLSLSTLTTCMCHMTGMGGFLYFMSWMMFHADQSPMSTASAFVTLSGMANLIVLFFFGFFAGSIIPVVLLAVLVLATVALTR